MPLRMTAGAAPAQSPSRPSSLRIEPPACTGPCIMRPSLLSGSSWDLTHVKPTLEQLPMILEAWSFQSRAGFPGEFFKGIAC